MKNWMPPVLLAGAVLALLGTMIARGELSLFFTGLFILLLPAGITAALLRWWPGAGEADRERARIRRRRLRLGGAGVLAAALLTLVLGLLWSGTAPGGVLLVAGIFLLPPAALVVLLAGVVGRRSLVQRLLEPRETVVHRGSVHRGIFVPAALVLVLSVVLAVGPFGLIGQTAAAVLYLLVLPASAAYALLVFVSTEVLVTEERVLLASGLLRRRTLVVPRGEMRAVGVAQRWLGRLLGYGKLSVVRADGRTLLLPGMADPHGLRERLRQQPVRLG